MKTRILILLGLFVGLIQPVWAQEIPLIPFTDDTFEIEGVIPEGWTSTAPGVYVRGSSPSDLTTLALQSAPVPATAVMSSLLPNIGLTEEPATTGSLTTPAFTWTLYQAEHTQNGVTLRYDIAITEANGTSYVALLIAPLDEAEALYATVFAPAIEALMPLAEDEDVPYQVEEVTFTNGEITLAGTLTLPAGEGQHPAVVLMTGSGPQDRDEMVVPGFRIFKLIADHLTRQGIAVLRYDDRGVGQSTGDYNAASIEDLASDGAAAVAYLQTRDEIDPAQVGLLGHSEGGIYAAMLGANPDTKIAFIITVAGTAVNGRELLLHQNREILASSGATQDIIDSQIALLNDILPLAEARDWEGMEQLYKEKVLEQWALLTPDEQAALGGDAEAYAQQTAASFRQIYGSEWFVTLLDYNPADDWAQTTVPVLAIFGAKDVQVDEAQNAVPLTEALIGAGNTDFAVVVLPDANHVMQAAQTGGIEEYMQLEKAFTPAFLPTLTDWLLHHVTVVE